MLRNEDRNKKVRIKEIKQNYVLYDSIYMNVQRPTDRNGKQISGCLELGLAIWTDYKWAKEIWGADGNVAK